MMRVGFAGTPAFAATALQAIVAAGFDVPVVLTQPDRPKGRGLALQASEVKAAAQALGLRVWQPATLKSPELEKELAATPLDVLVVAAYGLILPPAVLAWPRHGGLNIHASLLPRWRGAAPIQRALLAGDEETGVSIMRMEAGLDTGPVVLQVPVRIEPRDTTGTLQARLAKLGSDAIVRVLHALAAERTLHATAQPKTGVTYAAKVDRGEALIDWGASSHEIDRKTRAFDPTPGAFTFLKDATWKVWRSEPLDARPTALPGTVVGAASDAIVVACGAGALRIHELQPAGSRRLGVGALLAGRRIAPGDVFGGSTP